MSDVSFVCAPKEKFIVVGHVYFHKAMLHLGKDTLQKAIEFVQDILSGKIEIKSIIATTPEDFTGIDIIDDKGETLWSHGGPYGSFLVIGGEIAADVEKLARQL
ncbi:MAG: hypothetical protein ABFQ53_04165 [Patescibacteria group bacterium]